MKLGYDHYKDSATIIREREKVRDRLLVSLIVELGVLGVATSYSAAFNSSLKEVTVAGVKSGLAALPIPAVVAALWAAAFFTSLRYGQAALTIERQYKYLHRLEQELTTTGSGVFFSREGISYRNDYPTFSRWVKVAYRYVIPIATMFAVVTMLLVQINSGTYPIAALAINVALGLSIAINLALLRLLPGFAKLSGRNTR